MILAPRACYRKEKIKYYSNPDSKPDVILIDGGKKSTKVCQFNYKKIHIIKTLKLFQLQKATIG